MMNQDTQTRRQAAAIFRAYLLRIYARGVISGREMMAAYLANQI